MASNLMVLEKIKSTAHLVDIVALSDTYNGYAVKLGAKGSTGTYTVSAPSAVTDEGIAIVINEDLQYDASYVSMNDVTFTAGDVLRAVIPELGDVICIPQANITATSALTVGYVVVPKASVMKMECLSAFAGTEVVGFIIETLFTKAGVAMARLRCIRTQK